MTQIKDFFNNITLDDVIKILIALLIALLFNIFSGLIARILIRIIDGKKALKVKGKLKENYLFKPTIGYLKLLGIYVAILFFNPHTELLNLIHKLFRIITILFVCKAISSYINSHDNIIKRLNSKFNNNSKAVVLISKSIIFIVYFVGFAFIISEFGYDISKLVTGLGIVGVIITLAAQDTAKNLIGGIVIILDKPFSIGNWIQTGDIEGIVEDISFRSTRIRTFKDSLISIPNSTITNTSIINWSKMKKRKTTLDIELVLDTSIKKVYEFNEKVKKMLIEDEDILNENIAVNFSDITANGYNIKISYFTNATSYYDYLKVKEKINFEIMQIVENDKIGLAYNSLDVYLKK